MSSSVESRPSSSSRLPVEDVSIGEYLIQRLQHYGLSDVFGIPGDYVLGFYSMLNDSPINVVGCCREDCAGFAADAYARIHGLGAVCVTYCVGGLSLSNSIAGAYAEKSPVVVISGSPGLNERINNPLLHHKVRDFRTQYEVFEKLCVAGTELTDPATAFREIDRVLEAVSRYKRPGYIEIPRDMVKVVPSAPHVIRLDAEPASDPDSLAEAVAEAARWLSSSKRPVVIAGVEVHRFGLQEELLKLVESTNLPVSATLLDKSVIREDHPLYIGLYQGAMGREEVTRYVEDSDCLLILGAFMTDINLGIGTANLDPAKSIYVTSEQLRIRHHHYRDVLLGDFMRALTAAKPTPPRRELPKVTRSLEPFKVEPDAPIRIMRLIARLNESLDDNTVVTADIGDALFSATELVMHNGTEFLSPAYYTTMGFSVPAALGAGVARPGVRTVALVGDGAFQMTGLELSTIIRQKHHTIVIVLDNKGYGTERFLHPGDFNDINPWQYAKLPEILGGGKGYEVRTEGEFDAALSAAWKNPTTSLIQVHLSEDDCSFALKRLAEKLSKKV